MIVDVFYLFLWDNIKLHTVNVSIIGFGVLVFSLWSHNFQKFITWLLKLAWKLWSFCSLAQPEKALAQAPGGTGHIPGWHWCVVGAKCYWSEKSWTGEGVWTSLICSKRADYFGVCFGHRCGDLHPIDFTPITELSGAVLCWTAWSTQLTGGITLLYRLILSFISLSLSRTGCLGKCAQVQAFWFVIDGHSLGCCYWLCLCTLLSHNPPQTNFITLSV